MPDTGPTAAVAVIICAYTEQRWVQLCAAVEAVAAQTPPPAEVVVVVDHNPALLALATAELPGYARHLVVVANQGRRGLSGARNTGVEVSTAPLVAFLDDDAVPRCEWLSRLVAPLAEAHIVAAGGRCLPGWPVEGRPRWFPEEFLWVVGSSYRGLPTTRSSVRNVIGASMAFRRSALDAAGPFREDIGRVGTRPLGCEETELCIRLRQVIPGADVVYVPESVVVHAVSRERLSWRYFRARCVAEGRSKAQVTVLVGTGDGLASERHYVLRTLPGGILAGCLGVVRREPGGLARTSAIVAGLAWTGAGYLAARVQLFPAAQTTAGSAHADAFARAA